jgi:hypothetical protein
MAPGCGDHIQPIVYKPEANEPDAKIEDLPSDLKSAG